ncbi:MAG: electron transfer flavoprotein subunit alpha/FixB family protein [Candidatus Heimdallarchaeota archaeon]|nr:electron transfer flavoprotein subunit alpha/FixB family protein [Candidatus Heimdallarchaeota archaeon]MDH5646301.1 electron transfer flavoprotein subunit alpha/FixB family protein [Candidatus Heimdallarchaeota archaeon]
MSILVVAETFQGEVLESTFELLALGKELADGLGQPLNALVIGNGISDKLGDFGHAGEVIVVEDGSLSGFVSDSWGQIVSSVAQSKGCSVVLLANSSQGWDYGASVAGKLNGQFLGFCGNVVVDGGNLKTSSQLFGGKLNVSSNNTAGCTVICCQPGIRAADQGKVAGGNVSKQDLGSFGVSSKITFKQIIEPSGEDIDITAQEVLVSIGRGIQDEGNIELAEELAEALGGAVSASRPIVDQGWLPKTRQVGKSGKTVKPKLYLALGISGAPEHVEGMRDGNLIIAVNTDENAPIFDVAAYGIVADILDFIPELTEAVNEKKGA